MDEIRCVKCGKRLGYITGSYEIKCPRCGTMNATKEREVIKGEKA